MFVGWPPFFTHQVAHWADQFFYLHSIKNLYRCATWCVEKTAAIAA